MHVTVLYFDGCPNWQTVDQRLSTLIDHLGITVTRRKVTTHEEADAIGFRGPPTILIDGRDVFARGDEPVGLACRIYQTPDGPAGAPKIAQLRAALS